MGVEKLFTELTLWGGTLTSPVTCFLRGYQICCKVGFGIGLHQACLATAMVVERLMTCEVEHRVYNLWAAADYAAAASTTLVDL